MKATGIVRRIDDLGRVVIPKQIRRTIRIRQGDPTLTTFTQFDRFYAAVYMAKRIIA
jgi:bifunctional DNA-binding transcriptional regulator/antitoxin component of YhaV-PrlF toxin-antitoxin module